MQMRSIISLVLLLALSPNLGWAGESCDERYEALASKTGAAKAVRLSRVRDYVELPGFGRVFVDILPGKLKKKDPVLFLGGVSYDLARSEEYAKELNAKGFTVIRLDLLGQGRTLLEQVNKGTYRKGEAIPYEKQVQLVKALQEKLGLDQVVISGISYGGAIASAYAKQFPDKVSKALLIAPYVMSFEQQFPGTGLMFSMMKMNPFGRALYEQQSRMGLQAIGGDKVPEYFKNASAPYFDALYELSEGLPPDFRDVFGKIHVPVHVLKVNGDQAVLEPTLMSAWRNVPESSRGSMESINGVHDIVGAEPAAVAEWTKNAIDRQ